MKVLGAALLIGSFVFLASGIASAGSCDTDFNGDGVTNESDFDILKAVIGSSEGGEGYSPVVDLNGDGEIDLVDLTVYLSCNQS